MKTKLEALAGLALLAVVALALGGCEDSDITAPTDGGMVLRANPSTVVIDPNTDTPDPVTGRFNKTSTIEALLVDASGRPLQGVSVLFSTSAGTLASQGTGSIKTDSSGIARDILTLSDVDPDEVDVQAVSAALSESVKINKILVGGNELPRALVNFVPFADDDMDGIPEGQVERRVTFDGSGSTDPDGTITCYQWELTSDNPDAGRPNPIIEQGPGVSGLQLQFVNEQTLAVTLRVSDKTETGALCDPAMPPVPQTLPGGGAAFSPLAFFGQYELLCKNTRPTAIIAGPDSITRTGSPSQLTSIILDGSLSDDPETPIGSYKFVCGNGTSPIFQGPPSIATCRYSPGTYTATLEVTDQGQLDDMGVPTFRCVKTSAKASVTINILTP